MKRHQSIGIAASIAAGSLILALYASVKTIERWRVDASIVGSPFSAATSDSILSDGLWFITAITALVVFVSMLFAMYYTKKARNLVARNSKHDA